MNRVNWALVSFLLGLGSLLVGGLLVARTAHTNTGSAGGWLLIALGIGGLMTALAIESGAYSR